MDYLLLVYLVYALANSTSCTPKRINYYKNTKDTLHKKYKIYTTQEIQEVLDTRSTRY